jgi:hypothetical protein
MENGNFMPVLYSSKLISINILSEYAHQISDEIGRILATHWQVETIQNGCRPWDPGSLSVAIGMSPEALCDQELVKWDTFFERALKPRNSLPDGDSKPQTGFVSNWHSISI